MQLCITCLGKYIVKNCGSKLQCRKDGCTSLHHPLLHSENDGDEGIKNEVQPATDHYKKQNTRGDASGQATATTSSDANLLVHTYVGTKFKIVPVTLSTGENEANNYAFLDSGPNLMIVKDSLMRKVVVSGSSICLI